jgi:hypothetical protein
MYENAPRKEGGECICIEIRSQSFVRFIINLHNLDMGGVTTPSLLIKYIIFHGFCIKMAKIHRSSKMNFLNWDTLCFGYLKLVTPSKMV